MNVTDQANERIMNFLMVDTKNFLETLCGVNSSSSSSFFPDPMNDGSITIPAESTILIRSARNVCTMNHDHIVINTNELIKISAITAIA